MYDEPVSDAAGDGCFLMLVMGCSGIVSLLVGMGLITLVCKVFGW